MNRSLRIAVAEDEPFMQNYLKETLADLGHTVVAVASTGQELVAHCDSLRPELVITDIKMPHMDGLDAAAEIYRSQPIPIIVISAYHDRDLIERAEQNHVVAYLVKPIKHDDLAPAIAIAMRRFAEFQAMRQEATDLRQALEDRKLVERAKGIIMKRMGLSEPDAFQHLQKTANDKRCKVIEIARIILSAEEILSVPHLTRPK